MRALRSWLLRLAALVGHGARSDAEIAEELRAHRDLLAAEYHRSGLTSADARRRAAAEIGSLDAAAEAYRDRAGIPALERTLADARLAARSLARTPVLTLSMVLVLGLGIGLSTAIAAVFRAIVWAELPVAQPDAVMRVHQGFEGVVDRRVQGQVSNFSYPEFQTYRATTRAFAAMTAVSSERVTWRRPEGSRIVPAAFVTGDYFRVLPVTPALGRLLTAADTHQSVAVISHRLWSTAFEGAPAALGATMILDRSPYTIVGVAPPSFFGTDVDSVAVWLPLEAVQTARRSETALAERNLSWLELFGRLAPGASQTTAAAEAAAVAAIVDRDYPGRRTTIGVTTAAKLDSGAVQNHRRPFLTATAVAAGIQVLLFLICGSNAAALLLARGATRQREMAVRMALGASRSRLVAQLASEVGLIALGGAAAGLLVCFATLRGLASVVPIEELLRSIQPDAAVFGFALAAGFGVAGLFGVAPAHQALRVDCLASLKGEGSALGRHVPALRVRRALMAIQIAVSLVLLVAASVLGRVVTQAWRADTGFDTRRVHIVQLDSDWQPGQPPAATGQVGAALAEAVAAATGVRAVARATLAPFFGTGFSQGALDASGPVERIRFNQIDARFFDALGVALVAGRSFLPREHDAVVINAALARRFWGSEPPAIGRTLFIPPPPGPDAPFRAMRVVGVTPPLQTSDGGVPDAPTYYTLLTDSQAARGVLVVGADAGVPVRDLVLDRLRAIDPDAFAVVTRLDDRLVQKTTPLRLGVATAGLIGLLALVIAAVGVHGVIAFTVACRTHEIGIHHALGARPAQVLRIVLGWTLRGVAAGALAAMGGMLVVAGVFGARLQASLNGVHPLDPLSFLLGACVLLAAIAAAAYLPARRAVGLEPLAALRNE